MVDAGYLLRQSIEIISQRTSTARGDLTVTNPAGLIDLLLEKSKNTLCLSSKELLRIYWYDGVMATGLTGQQRSIMKLPDLHFRAGTVNKAGAQKGVDSLITTDLIELATNHAICDALLVTGDGDLAIAIEGSSQRHRRTVLKNIATCALRTRSLLSMENFSAHKPAH